MSLARSFKQNFDRELESYAEKVKNTMQSEVPVDSGALRDSVSVEKQGSNSYLVGVDAAKLRSDPRNVSGYDYSGVVYFGIKGSKTITKRDGGVFRWVGRNGEIVYRRSFTLGPRPGNDFIRRTVARRPKFG